MNVACYISCFQCLGRYIFKACYHVTCQVALTAKSNFSVSLVSSSSWNCGVSTLLGNAQKPTGITDVCNKFRPVKRVSPLKHQPESSENNESDDQKNQKGEYQKGSDSQSAPPNDDQSPGEGESLKSKSTEPAVLLGELEHYDLDMDEILDVPYIKSSQQLVPFTKVAPEKKLLSVCSTMNGLSGKSCSAGSTESSPAGGTQFCVLSPVKGAQLRKTQPIVPISTSIQQKN